jgi:hypothetical protein
VVVETAINAAHGAATGTVAELEACLAAGVPGGPGGAPDLRTLTLARIGTQLALEDDPCASDLWRNIATAQGLASEDLAYAAAFATGSTLVFGDRPKAVSYQRMLWRPSVADLDAAYAAQSASNYQQVLGRPPPPPPAAPSVVDLVFMVERDAVLLASLHEASLAAGEGRQVVGVVGASHLGGMRRLWAEGGWRALAAAAAEAPAARGEGDPPEALGVRRALFDSFIRLSCTPSVSADVEATLPPPPPAAADAYDLALELYGNSRMLLAALGREALGEVCSGWRCNMWEVLAPLRAARPANGGSGLDQVLVEDLRALNFEIAPPAGRA